MLSAQACMSGMSSSRSVHRHQSPVLSDVADGIYLGIDNGSSGLRVASIRVVDGVAEDPIYVESVHENMELRMAPGNFEVRVPIDGDRSKPLYYPSHLEMDLDRPYAPLKYVIWVLSGTESPEELPVQCKDILVFKQRCPYAWKRYLEDVAAEAFQSVKESVCGSLPPRSEHLPWRMCKLTIPDHWEGRQMDTYARLLSRGFDIDPTLIQFCLESQAQHRHYHSDPRLLSKLDVSDAEGCYLLAADFGGMSCSFSLYFIHRDGEMRRYYQVEKSVGVSGGSEEWEFRVVGLVASVFRDHNGREPCPRELRDVLGGFNFHKRAIGRSSKMDSWTYTIPLVNAGGDDKTKSTFNYTIHEQDARQQFEVTMKKALERFDKQLLESQTHASGAPLFVVVHGGMAGNRLLQNAVTEIATRQKMVGLRDRLIFTKDYEARQSVASIQLAKGAAQLATETQTLTEFRKNGAAWGLQMKQKGSTEGDRQSRYVPFKAGDPRGTTGRGCWRLPLEAGDSLMLVVDPFFNESGSLTRSGAPSTWIEIGYEYLDLGIQRSQGESQLRLSVEDGPTTGTGVLHLEKRIFHKRSSRWGWWHDYLLVPTWYDSGARTWRPGCPTRGLGEALQEMNQPLDFQLVPVPAARSTKRPVGGLLERSSTDRSSLRDKRPRPLPTPSPTDPVTSRGTSSTSVASSATLPLSSGARKTRSTANQAQGTPSDTPLDTRLDIPSGLSDDDTPLVSPYKVSYGPARKPDTVGKPTPSPRRQPPPPVPTERGPQPMRHRGPRQSSKRLWSRHKGSGPSAMGDEDFWSSVGRVVDEAIEEDCDVGSSPGGD